MEGKTTEDRLIRGGGKKFSEAVLLALISAECLVFDLEDADTSLGFKRVSKKDWLDLRAALEDLIELEKKSGGR